MCLQLSNVRLAGAQGKVKMSFDITLLGATGISGAANYEATAAETTRIRACLQVGSTRW